MSKKENFMKWDNPGIALITGASSGIGAEFARQLAEQGFDLILVARRKERLIALNKGLQEKYSISSEVLVADLANMTDNDKVVSRILEVDNLDVLINNAGFGRMTSFLETDLKKNIDMIHVHFTSLVMFCHAALQAMIKRKRGVIINTSSSAIMLKPPIDVMYNTTKAANTIFSEALKSKLRGTGVYIQSLLPGFTYSEFHDTKTMQGFQRKWFPKEAWMTSEAVVSLSLEAVKTKRVIFIPGEYNQHLAKSTRKVLTQKFLNLKIF